MAMGKFKNWLIKKLGGYTAPAPRTVKFEHAVMEPVTLFATVELDKSFSGLSELWFEHKDKMLREALKDIADILYQNPNLVRTVVQKDPMRTHDKMTVQVRVLSFMEDSDDGNV